MTAAIQRPAARVVLLDPRDRILLFRFLSSVSGRSWWITPGGGLDQGETHVEAALRELEEECGLTGVSLGPCVWIREHEFTWHDTTYLQQERYFVAHTEPFEVSTRRWTEEENEVLSQHRWWSVDEIERSNEVFAPRQLGQLLRALLRDGPPAEPLDAGV